MSSGKTKITIVTTYNVGAPLFRIASIINVLEDFQVHLVGPFSKSDILAIPSLSNENFEVHSVGSFVSKQKNFFIRFFQELFYSIKCSRKAKKIHSEIEIVTIPFSLLIISSYLVNSKAKKIIDIRDLVWEYLDESGAIKRLMKTLFKGLHILFLRKFEVITVTNKIEKEILERDLTNAIEIVSNGISQFNFDQIRSEMGSESSEIRNDVIKITYIGNVGLLQDLGILIDVVRNYDKVELVIVGDGNDFERIEQKINEEGIGNVKLVGRVKEEQIFKYYKETNYLFASLDARIVTAVPSKLYEYLAIGKPIIYCGKGAAIDLLESFDNVITCDYNHESIDNVIRTIGDTSIVKSSKSNLEILERNFVRERVSQKFVSLINERLKA